MRPRTSQLRSVVAGDVPFCRETPWSEHLTHTRWTQKCIKDLWLYLTARALCGSFKQALDQGTRGAPLLAAVQMICRAVSALILNPNPFRRLVQLTHTAGLPGAEGQRQQAAERVLARVNGTHSAGAPAVGAAGDQGYNTTCMVGVLTWTWQMGAAPMVLEHCCLFAAAGCVHTAALLLPRVHGASRKPAGPPTFAPHHLSLYRRRALTAWALWPGQQR